MRTMLLLSIGGGIVDCRSRLSDEQIREMNVEMCRQEAYDAICPPMNRAERRTARGKMLVAQAEAAALRAEVEYLRSELANMNGE